MPWIPGLAVRVFVHEQARTGSALMVDALSALVQQRQLAGITVTRGYIGWQQRIFSAPTLSASTSDTHRHNPPLTIEILDRTERIESVLPEIAALVTTGVLTVSETRLYVPASHLLVSEVMGPHTPTVAAPETPLAEVLRALLREGERLVPVLSPERTVLGVVTLGALVRQIDPALASHLAELHSPAHLHAHLERLAAGRTASDAMLTPARTVRSDVQLDVAAHLLSRYRVTRLPVVDAVGRLVGLLSEHEVARALVAPPAADGQRPLEEELLRLCVLPGQGDRVTAGVLAHGGVPLVPPQTPLEQAVKLMYDAPECVVLVVAASGAVRGILDERALLRHAVPESAAGLRTTLMGLLVRSPAHLLAALQHQNARLQTVADGMRSSFVSVAAQTPLADALAQLLAHPEADPAVVIAADGRPVGLLWQDEALRALAGGDLSDQLPRLSEAEGDSSMRTP